MSGAAKTCGPKQGGTYLARATAKWKPLPDWVQVLARAMDAEVARGGSQRSLAARMGFQNASVISGLIGKTYPGKLGRMERIVRGALMAETVDCPVEGEIASNRCAANQRVKPSAANPQRARLAIACKTCPNATGVHHAQS